MKAAREAITAEVRASIARDGRSHTELREAMGVSQTWFSRRYTGAVPWSTEEALALFNILDDDITRVLAAGTLAMAEVEQEERKTNLCLSDSATIGSARITTQGFWAQRGIARASLVSTRRRDLDLAASVA